MEDIYFMWELLPLGERRALLKYDRRQVQTFAAQGDLHRKSINVAVSWPGILSWFQFWPPREQLSMVINPAPLHGISTFPWGFPVLCTSHLMGGSYCDTHGNLPHPLRKPNKIKTSGMLQGMTVSQTVTGFYISGFLRNAGIMTMYVRQPRCYSTSSSG